MRNNITAHFQTFKPQSGEPNKLPNGLRSFSARVSELIPAQSDQTSKTIFSYASNNLKQDLDKFQNQNSNNFSLSF